MALFQYKTVETEKLRKKKRTYLIIAILIFIISLLSGGAALYFVAIEEYSTSTIFALLPAIVTISPVIILSILIAKIEKELKSRKHQENGNAKQE